MGYGWCGRVQQQWGRIERWPESALCFLTCLIQRPTTPFVRFADQPFSKEQLGGFGKLP